MQRRKVKARRGVSAKPIEPLHGRLQHAWDALLNSFKAPNDENLLDRVKTLGSIFLEPGASQQFIENGFANEFLSRIKENQDNPKTLATLVFILSDLIDIDSSGALAKYSTNNGILNLLFNLLRQKGTSLGSSSSSNDSPMSALGIKAAAFCCISAISFYCTGSVLTCMVDSDLDEIAELLQKKIAAPLHPRCLLFANNIYVSSEEMRPSITKRFLEPTLRLVVYNIANHIKLKKREAKKNVDLAKGHASPSTKPSDSQQKSSEVIDPLYDDSFYVELLVSSCTLLSNLTTNVETCEQAAKLNILDILIPLFHNNSVHSSLDLLCAIVKCLANLANLVDKRKLMLESNVLSIAVKLHIIANEFEELKGQLTLLIANLAGTAPGNKFLVDSGVVPSIVEFFCRTQNTTLIGMTLLALANISIEPSAVPILVRQEFVNKLVEVCNDTISSFNQRQAVRVLYSIASYPNGQYLGVLRQAKAETALLNVVVEYKVGKTIDKVKATAQAADSSKPSTEEYAVATLALLQGRLKVHPIAKAETLSTEVKSKSESSPETQLEPIETNHNASAQQATSTDNTAQAHFHVQIPPIQGVPRRDRPPLDLVKANESKEKGNEFFRQGKYKEAILCYTKAAEYNPTDHTLFSNRSAAYTNLEQYELALKDAEKCIELAPDWVKGYFRKGKALFGLQQYVEAVDSLQHALTIERSNREIQEALKMAQAKMKEPKQQSSMFGIPKLVVHSASPTS